jgi:hypothetical protein
MKKTLLSSFLVVAGICAFGQVTVTLEASKDAQVYSVDPTGSFDRGTDRSDIVIYEWTKDGTPSTKYGLIDFDFSAIPANSVITEATLSLYHDAASVDPGHSQLSGSNEAVIQRMTSDWAETVSWDGTPSSVEENETTISASTSETQDYEIDLLALTQDVINDQSNSFGFLIKMVETSHYRSLVFASSEHSNSDLHPKLVVKYTVPTSGCVTLSSSEGKDTQIWSADPTGSLDRGTDRSDIVIYEWTKDGTPTSKYGLIDFDFSAIPANSEITEATLSLYHDATSVDEGHSQLSGANEAVIQRITSDWSETVSWDETPSSVETNEKTIAASTSETQDYEIDLLALTQDVVNDKSNSFGFLIKMVETTHYRSLVFASGEHDDTDLQPTLNVCFSSVITDPIASITEFKVSNEGFVYPNPVNGGLLCLNKSVEVDEFQLMDALGTIVLEGNVNNNTIDVSEVSSGVYLLKVDGEIIRIVKN